jgi:tyrosine-protein phosphatase SIW14
MAAGTFPAPRSAPRARARRLVPIALALALAAGLFYRFAVRDNVFPKNFGVVEPGKVFRSGQLTPAAFRRVVEAHGVRTVVDLGSALRPDGRTDDPRVERLNQRVAESLGLTRYRFNLAGDGTGNPNYYVAALRVMTDPSAQPVLVHCGAGSERTGAAAILYRRLTAGTPIEQAYAEAGEYRHDARRNPRLKEVLDRYGEAIVRAARAGAGVPGADPLPPVTPTTRGAAPGR